MRIAALVAAGVFALGLAGPAAHAQDRGEQCFFQHSIENFIPTDDEKTIYLRITGGAVYRIDLASQCPGLAFRDKIELNQFGNGNICSALDLDLKLREGRVAVPCILSGLHRLTPVELAAVPKKYRP